MDAASETGAVAEGKKFDFLPESEIRTDFLSTFPFDSPTQKITTITPEFSAVCPFSGLPDIAELTIIYKAVEGLAVELKSLKYYVTSFRPVGIYQEGVTKRIFEDMFKLLFPELAEATEKAGKEAGKDYLSVYAAARLGAPIYVRTRYNVRGGFDTICEEGNLELK